MWSKTIPTVDGVYWWRLSENDPDPDICETDLDFGFVYDIGDPVGAKISERGGEWLGPVCPSPEVITLNDYVTLLERNNGRLREVLKEALDQTGCDGDLCNYRWHEKARVLLGEDDVRV